MTLISRDQMPPRTPYEADLRDRLERLQGEMDLLRRLAGAQRPVVESARNLLMRPITGAELDDLRTKLEEFDREIGKILLDSMPPALREGLTVQEVGLFPIEKARRA